jgi:hypothetical protein
LPVVRWNRSLNSVSTGLSRLCCGVCP